MTGKPQTRYELVEGLGTSVTTVNRVVAQLEKAGAIVTREIGSDGRQAVFRVVDVTGPKAARPYLHLGDQVRVVAARVSGDDMVIDVSVDKHTYRGVVRGVVTNVNLGGYATVQGIELVDDTLSERALRGTRGHFGRPHGGAGVSPQRHRRIDGRPETDRDGVNDLGAISSDRVVGELSLAILSRASGSSNVLFTTEATAPHASLESLLRVHGDDL